MSWMRSWTRRRRVTGQAHQSAMAAMLRQKREGMQAREITPSRSRTRNDRLVMITGLFVFSAPKRLVRRILGCIYLRIKGRCQTRKSCHLPTLFSCWQALANGCQQAQNQIAKENLRIGVTYCRQRCCQEIGTVSALLPTHPETGSKICRFGAYMTGLQKSKIG